MLYKYRPLENDNTIRLLHLHPSHEDKQLSCSIVHVDHNDNPDYEALSYVWGDATSCDSLFIETDHNTRTTRLEITQNLSEALHALQPAHGPARILWVDAACIDQSNTEERNHQVQRMGHIYHAARSVVVWLGSQPVLRFGPNITLPKRKVALILESVARYSDTIRRYAQHEVQALSEYLQPLISVNCLNAPWFSRVWIVQEFVLARKVFFQCDQESFSADLVKEVVTLLAECSETLTLTRKLDERMAHSLEEILFLARRTHQLFLYREQWHGSGSQRESRPSLLRCFVDLSRGRSCTDERDRLYSMLGLARNDSLKPDYGKSISEVYNDFATQCLLSGELSILHESGLGPHQYAASSFVPCVFNRATLPRSLEHKSPAFRAGAACPVSVRQIRPGSFGIRGVHIDTVVGCAGFVTQSNPPYYSCLTDPARLASDETETWGFSTTYQLRKGQKHLQQEIAKTAHAMTLRTTSPFFSPKAAWPNSPESITKSTCGGVNLSHAQYLRTLSLDDPGITIAIYSTEPAGLLLKRINTSLHNRVLFWTLRGYLGLGSRYLHRGDDVVIFDGGTTPFVLRGLGSDGSGGEKSWLLVGDCYLDGWMDGRYAGFEVGDGKGSGRARLEGGVQRTQGSTASWGRTVLIKEDFVLR